MTNPRHTAGRWSHDDRPLAFLAGDANAAEYALQVHRPLLIPINDITMGQGERLVERFLDGGAQLLIDSGVFSLGSAHAQTHMMTLRAARALPPGQIDGYDALFTRYCAVVERFGSRSWGYVELDQGTTADKRATRGRLESMGLRPIPVYHPLFDGWDYFDELASSYDRICVANLARSHRGLRIRIMATIAERRRAYPHLWVHLLGMTASDWTAAYRVDSLDSSSWLHLARWAGGMRVRCALQPFGDLSKRFTYRVGADGGGPDGHFAAKRLGAYDVALDQRAWAAMDAARASLGLDTTVHEWPAASPGEPAPTP